MTMLARAALLLALPLLLAPSAHAERSACDAAKLTALGRRAASELGCHAKAARKGASADLVCVAKAEQKLADAFARAENGDDCGPIADHPTLAPLVESYVELLAARLRPTPDASACAAKKLAAAGKDASARLACRARAVRKDVPVDPEACGAKPEAALVKAFTKAEGKPPCLSMGDAGSTDLLVTEAALCLTAPTPAACPSIATIDVSIAPGTTNGYIALDLFGVAPQAITDEKFIEVATEPFVYGGVTYTAVSVNSNGYLVVGGGATSLDNQCCALGPLPNPARPNGVLAPFWTDLDGTGAPGIYTTKLTDGVSSWRVIEWRVNVFGTASLRKFQVWLGVNGTEDVVFAYDPAALPAAPPGGDLIVGAESADGTAGDSLPLGAAPTEDLRVTTTPTL